MTSPTLSRTDRQRLEEKLLKEVRETAKVYKIAAANHHEALEAAQTTGWKNTPDETETIYEAARGEHVALQHYMWALKAYSELILYGRSPATLSPDAAQRLDPLTPRESEVLRLIVSGLSSKEIAARLNISFKTVVTHRGNIMQKLDVHDVATLVRYAILHKLVES